MSAPIPLNESERLDALRQYQILDTAPEAAFDGLTQLAAQICQTPMASITFIDERRQWHKSNVGLQGSETERDLAFCAHTVMGDDLLLIRDTAQDERFRDNPFVTGEPRIRFYAGMPLVTPEGLSVGSICVVDTKPRELEPQQLDALRTLGQQAVAQLELRPDFSEAEAQAPEDAPARQSRQQRLTQRRRERQQVAQTLRDSDERYRALFEATREGLLILDAESGIVTEVNSFLTEMLAEDAPLLGRRVWQIGALAPLFPGESKWATMLQTLRGESDVRVAQIALQAGDGRKIWVEFRAHFDGTSGGDTVRCNLRDITGDTLTRTALDTQQRQHRALLELSLNAVVVSDANGVITQWNPAAEAMFGYERAEVIGRDLAQTIIPPALRDAHLQAFERQVSSGGGRILGQRVEVTALRADGSEFPVELAIARQDGEGGPIFLASLRDITSRKNFENAMQRAADELERHVIERTTELSETNARLQLKIADHQRAEERLAATAQRLRGVLESISDAFVSLDAGWRFTYVNDQALRLMNKTREELLGREVWQGFPGARQNIFDAEFCQAVCQGEPVTLESYYAPWKIWLEIHAYPSDEGLSIYFQDISARRADQFALEEAKREAEAANAAKSEFLGRISHELRTPLNAILGFGQILDRCDLDTQQRESVGYILKSGNHLLELINEVLDIARVESGQVELNLEPVALGDAIAQACAIVRPLADARDISLHLLTDDSAAEARVLADAQRFAQVMINLLSNAIKYNFERGEVEVQWHQIGEHWRVSVCDSGPGISAENLPRLFVPFERGAATDSSIEGTGLGLALSLNLVEAMNGKMDVESAPGRGSTFWFELPRTGASVAQAQAPAPPENFAPASNQADCNYRVLCIEDNPSNLRLVELVLSTRAEISLLSADCARTGLELAAQHEPDLILLDLNLPDMHGSQILARLHQSALTRDIPVIVISADATPAQIETLLDAGASDYLTKPLDMRQLLGTLDRILQPTPSETAASAQLTCNP